MQDTSSLKGLLFGYGIQDAGYIFIEEPALRIQDAGYISTEWSTVLIPDTRSNHRYLFGTFMLTLHPLQKQVDFFAEFLNLSKYYVVKIGVS